MSAYHVIIRLANGTTLTGDLFAGQCLVIGRGSESDISIPADLKVSNSHVRLCRHGDDLTIEDLRTTNGTLLDGITLDSGRPYPLSLGQQVRIGEARLEVRAAEAS